MQGLTSGMPAASLAGQVALITGGSAGIGLEAAGELAARGAQVVVVGHTPERVHQATAALAERGAGERVEGLILDVCCEEDMARMAAHALDKYGRIDVLIAAAGILRARGGVLNTVQAMPLEDWRRVIDVNLTGTFLSNRAVLPAMIRQRAGQIINVSSTSGRKAYAFDSAYCASKFGVIGMSEALAAEVRGHGIRVQVLLPGAVETPIWDQNGPIPKPHATLTAGRIAEVIARLVDLPSDAIMPETMIEPQRFDAAPDWLRRRAG
jgi:NAD(P)-dependent dehydrogenase (short-subunit alcohol dehydrogenase family)